MTKEEAWRRAKGYLYNALDWEEADEIIKALEQELKTENWTPVNEQSPKESGKYIVTFGGTHLIGIDFYITEEDARRDFEEYYEEYIGWSSGNVSAWMHLPEPYKHTRQKVRMGI